MAESREKESTQQERLGREKAPALDDRPAMSRIVGVVPKPDLSPNAFRRYLIAVAVSVVCLVVRWYLGRGHEDTFPYAAMFLPIAFSAYYGGFGPGLASVLVTLTVGNYLFVPPAFSLQIPHGSTALALLLLSMTGLVISVLGEANRRTLIQGYNEADIRRAAQEQLRANEQRLRIAESLLSGGVWDWDITTNSVYWSDAYRRLYDYTLDEKPSYEKWVASVHRDDRDRVLRHLDELFRQHLHNWSFEFRAYTGTGRVRSIASNGQIFYDDERKPMRMVGINVDITPRKAAEEEVRNNEARMRLLLQYARVGGWEWNPKERNFTWSDQMYDVLGLNRSLPSTFETWLRHIHPEDQEHVRKLVQRLLDGSEDQFQYEYRIIGSDGVERSIHERGTIVRDADGHSSRLVGVSFDITNRRQDAALETVRP
jgi:PAS domain S-box-containing protein